MGYIINDGCHSGKAYFSNNLYITCYTLWQNPCICVVLPRFSRKLGQYTRSQAVADGFQIKITKTAGETSTRLLTMAVIILVTTGSRTAYPPPAQNQTSMSG